MGHCGWWYVCHPAPSYHCGHHLCHRSHLDHQWHQCHHNILISNSWHQLFHVTTGITIIDNEKFCLVSTAFVWSCSRLLGKLGRATIDMEWLVVVVTWVQMWLVVAKIAPGVSQASNGDPPWRHLSAVGGSTTIHTPALWYRLLLHHQHHISYIHIVCVCGCVIPVIIVIVSPQNKNLETTTHVRKISP